MICQSNNPVFRLRWCSLPGIPHEPIAAAADPDIFVQEDSWPIGVP
jgi:hypothetical protein